MTGLTALGIMTRQDVRTANASGAALAVLSASLDSVIWANRPGARLLGVPVGMSDPSIPLDGTLPIARQIASSARRLREAGQARLMLRAPGMRSMKPIVADLTVLDPIEDQSGFVLFVAAELAAVDRDPQAMAWRLIEEAGLNEAAAAVLDDSGVLARTGAMSDRTLAETGDSAETFRLGEEPIAIAQDAGTTRHLARVADGMVLVWIEAEPASEAIEAAPAEETAAIDGTEPPAPPETSNEEETPAATPAAARSFSVKRKPLPSGRRTLDIGALIERWHNRRDPHPVSPTDPDMAEAEIETSSEPELPTLPLDPENGPDPVDPEPVELSDDTIESDDPHFKTDEEPSRVATRDELPLEEPAGTPSVDEQASEEPQSEVVDTDDPQRSAAGFEVEVLDADGAVVDIETDMEVADETESEIEGPSLDAEAPEEPASVEPEEAAETREAAADESPVAPARAGPFEPRFDLASVRFVWQIDSEGRFRSFSPEFAAAVGPQAADVIGRSFRDVAQVFDFDRDGEIGRLLERRDTWSGRSVFWPVQGTDRKVPVDLAALPTYARDRRFDGFRGFGIVRLSEAVHDPDAIGLLLSGEKPLPLNAEDAEPLPLDDEGEFAADAPESVEPDGPSSIFTTFSAETKPFGRRETPPDEATSAPSGTPQPDDHRRMREAILSEAEAAAFRAIGRKLGERNGHEDAETEKPWPDDARPVTADDFSASAAGDDADLRSEDTPHEATSDDANGSTEIEPAPEAPADSPDATEIDRSLPEDEPNDDTAVWLAPLRERLDQVFGSLPLAVLVQRRDHLVYANAPFLALSGYEDLDMLTEAGGLDALFAEPTEPLHDGRVALRRADGEAATVAVHLQRVSFADRACLVISFTPQPVETRSEQPPSEDLSEIDNLRREVEELQAVLNTATDGVVMLDHDGNIRGMNGAAQAIFATDPTICAGRPLSTLLAHESQRTAFDYLEMLKDDGLPAMLNDGREVTGRVAQGGFVPLFITAARLSEGRGYCVVIRDITHWKRVEDDLVKARRQAEEASLHKSQFLANISHELRTPLNAIIGFADVMASECFGPIGHERYLEYLTDIKRSGHHVLDLVNDLLDISKVEAGKADLVFEAVSLNDVISEACSLMQPQANRGRVIVRSNLPSSVPPVVADRRSMRQIALNLLSNAIRFTPPGGQVVASTIYNPSGDVVMRVRDSGIGMTEHEIEIALKPFQQVHTGLRERGDGTGLGLPLTKTMTEANEAHFSIKSTPGEGTLVEIAFPPQRVLAD
ncbi:ATP-binding protein [Consotaella aegiceratis]|uniref:ATP-binding protein n=1 Tax=Consotaella aegiceratis TaxID=3097961 RepID=UPI002F4252B8